MSIRRVILALVIALVALTLPVPPAVLAAGGDDVGSPGTGKLILLLDSSGSMKEAAGGGRTKITAAKKALDTVVSKLPPQASVGLRVFGAKVFSRTDKGACTDSQLVVAPGTDNRSKLTSAIRTYKPYGETPIPYALRQAAKDLGSSGPRSIVLVSDGESTCQPSPCIVAAELAKSGVDLHIDVVGLSVSGAARAQLKCIADKGNGSYYDADSASDIESRLVRVAERAARPFTVDGTPVTGGTETSPAAIKVGDFQDKLTPGTPLYYSYDRKAAGSTLRVASYLQESQGERFLNLEVTSPSGARCGGQTTGRSYDSRNVLGAQVTAGPDGTCAEAGKYLIKVSRDAYNGGSTVLPLGLRITDEPKIESPGFTSDSPADITAPKVSGVATSLRGGASFDAAPELRSGVYKSNAVPGEVNLYRFHLDYGQSARVSVRFAAATQAQKKIVGGIAGPIGDLALYSPMRARLAAPRDATFSGPVGVSPSGGAKALTLQTATPAVSAVNPVATGNFGAGGDFQTAGDYFLAVSLETQDYTVEFPYTIKIQVVGTAQPGPTYAGGVKWNVTDGTTSAASSSPSPRADAHHSANAPADSGSGSRTLLWVLVGIAGVVVLGAAALLWRRTRTG